MTDPDAAREYLVDYLRHNARPLTQSEFVKNFNQGLANAKLEQWTDEGLIASPTPTEMREEVLGQPAPKYRTITIRGYTRHTKVYLKEGGVRLKSVRVKPYQRKVKL